MKTLYLAAALALLPAATALAAAPDPTCQPWDQYRADLRAESEKVLFWGKTAEGWAVVVAVNPSGTGFTVARMAEPDNPQSETCTIARGLRAKVTVPAGQVVAPAQ